MKKKVDSRIQTLIDNNIKSHQRTMLVMVGDRSRYQIVNFHYMMTKHILKTKPAVLWCYKDKLGFSSHQEKRRKEVKNMQMKGLYDENIDDPFDLFISSTEIRYSYYKQSHKVLGNTFQMLVLQDFEAITPNVLCRTIETVEGGGIIIFLLKTMTSLKQLYTLTMDVHQRYRTEAFETVQPRFNERFILSLSECRSCIFMDDELNILPISSHLNDIEPISESSLLNKKVDKELQLLKASLEEKEIIGPLVKKAKTLDQAKVIMSVVDTLLDKSNNNKTTVSLTAGRGRGKSAAIGLAIAAALKVGFSNIFVTAPSPENLKTLFEFVLHGLELLQFKDRMDYEKIYSTNKEYDKVIIRVNLFKTHKQFVQYVFPNDGDKIGNTDLVVIDEAAAIPIPYVKSFFGQHHVLMSSTINGYEGTGRSLSLKLIQQIKDQNKKNGSELHSFRKFKEVTMTDPIRYALNDEIERWLNDLLLLSATQPVPLKHGIPHPNDCDLYIVNRDSLFSYKKTCEKFLLSLMSLFISSHYKNSPNDLQLISDSPSHMIFVLCGPLKKSGDGKTEMPDILCAIQLAMQGNLSRAYIHDNTQRGLKPSGDLIPWNIRQQFQDNEFPKLAGGRVVRIATHPTTQKMGYGSRALELLTSFFEKKLISMDDSIERMNYNFKGDGVAKPLLKKLEEVIPPNLQYLGTSFGFTTNLVKFWRKNGFESVYLRQTVNDITSEHSGIMLKALQNDDSVLNTEDYVSDFKKRLMNLLGYEFRKLHPSLALQILSCRDRKALESNPQNAPPFMERQYFQQFISLRDYNRLKSYANNQADYHLVIDLVPTLAKLYFSRMIGGNMIMSYTQEAILIGVGLQHKTMEEITTQIDDLKMNQCLPLFLKSMIKFSKAAKQIFEKQAEQTIPEQKRGTSTALGNQSHKTKEFGEKEKEKLKEPHKRGPVNYQINQEQLQGIEQEIPASGVITIPRKIENARNDVVFGKPKKKLKK